MFKNDGVASPDDYFRNLRTIGLLSLDNIDILKHALFQLRRPGRYTKIKMFLFLNNLILYILMASNIVFHKVNFTTNVHVS